MSIARRVVSMKRSSSCSLPGVWKAAAHSEGAIVVFHSPKACVHVAREMNLGSYMRALAKGEREKLIQEYEAPMIASGLTEEHAVFGGAEELSECLDYVVEHYRPSYILVANSCVAGVIGDDTEAAAANAEEKWKIPIISVPSHGFLSRGYHAGYYHAAKAIVDRLMRKQEMREGTVVFLGDRGTPKGKEMRYLHHLTEYFNLTPICHFPSYASRFEIEEAAGAEIMIPIGGGPQSFRWMRRLAGDIHEKFGTPFLDLDYPLGMEGTKNWLRALGKHLGKETLAEEAIRAEEVYFRTEAECFQKEHAGIPLLCCIARPLVHMDPNWVVEFLRATGAELRGFMLLDGMTEEQKSEMKKVLRSLSDAPIFTEEDGREALREAELIVTTHELKDLSKKQLFLPVLPPIGVWGMTELLKAFRKLVKRHKKRGGVVYGW